MRRDATENHSFQDFKCNTQQGNRPVALGDFSVLARFQDCYDVGFSPCFWDEVEAKLGVKEAAFTWRFPFLTNASS